MSSIVAIGERRRVDGFVLAGVEVLAAETPREARAAWARLAADVAVVILSRSAHAAIADLLPARPNVIWTTMPE